MNVRAATEINDQCYGTKARQEYVIRTGADRPRVRGVEHVVLVPVRQIPCLFDKRRGKPPPRNSHCRSIAR